MESERRAMTWIVLQVLIEDPIHEPVKGIVLLALSETNTRKW